MFTLMLSLCTLAAAGAYTVDDLGRAAQRGLPDPTLEVIAASVGPLDTDAVLTLLRYGVDPAWIRAHTADAHPTPEEVAAASAAGPIALPPREFAGLSDAAWRQLVGVDIVVRTTSGLVGGRLEDLRSGALTLATVDGAREIALGDLSTVRRADGVQIRVHPEADLRPAMYVAPPPSRAKSTGHTLLAGGLGALAFGTVAAVAAGVQAQATTSAVGSGDFNGAIVHGGGSMALGYIGGLGLIAGGPLTVTGVVVLAVDAHKHRHGRADQSRRSR